MSKPDKLTTEYSSLVNQFLDHQSFIYVEIFIDQFLFTISEARDHSNFNANIAVKWDLMNWTPDGYVVSTKYSDQYFNVTSSNQEMILLIVYY